MLQATAAPRAGRPSSAPAGGRPIAPTPIPAPAASSPSLLSYGTLTLGLGAAMLPFMVTMIVIMVPVHWLFAASDRR